MRALYLFALVAFIPVVLGNVGDPCSYDIDCFMANSYCEKQKTCRCKSYFRASDDGQTCLATIGAPCINNDDCRTLVNSYCYTDTCDCKEGYVPDARKQTCLQASTSHNDSVCSYDSQCTYSFGESARCLNSKCLCNSNYHYDKIIRRCLYDKHLGQSCKNNSECYINEQQRDRIECRENICKCNKNYNEKAGLCSNKAHLTKTTLWPVHFILLAAIFKSYFP